MNIDSKIRDRHQRKINKGVYWSKGDERAYKKAKREKERGETLTLEQVK